MLAERNEGSTVVDQRQAKPENTGFPNEITTEN